MKPSSEVLKKSTVAPGIAGIKASTNDVNVAFNVLRLTLSLLFLIG